MFYESRFINRRIRNKGSELVIKFTVPGITVGKARPRVTRHGTYTPKKTKDYEQLVQICCRNKYKDKPLEGPIRIDIYFYVLIPKNTSKVRTKAKIEGSILPTKRPDFDNMTKSITDALNGLAYKDDNQIVEAHIYKYFSDNPRAEVEIRKIDKEGI